MKPSTGRPSENPNTAGIDLTPSWPAIWGLSSILIFTIWTRPADSPITFSSIGVSCLHGPHQGAQKSTTIGTFFDASITSAANVSVFTSFTAVEGDAEGSPGKGVMVLIFLIVQFLVCLPGRAGDRVQINQTWSINVIDATVFEILACQGLARVLVLYCNHLIVP